MTMAVFFGIYATIGGRLVYLGLQDPDASGGPASRVTASRPDIVDRNGEVLATDIKTASLFAEPRRIVDADEVIEKLSTVLPDIEVEQTYHKLKSGAGFVWLKRQLTPKQQNDIMQLGLPGIGFRTEKRRFYPGGADRLAHRRPDQHRQPGHLRPREIHRRPGPRRPAGIGPGGRQGSEAGQAVDRPARPAHRARRDSARRMERYHAIAAGAVVLNVKTGEVVAMASLPDYDPNNPVQCA